MGNTVVWKAAPTQAAAAYVIMQLLEAAGLPAGVINLVFGDGPLVSDVVLADPRLAGIHFTGSTAVFQSLWQQVGNKLSTYRGYPRLVGETGGKDFVVAHSSADPEVLTTALIRGAFDFQGQKCSAASRAFVPVVGVGADGRRLPRQGRRAPLRRRHRLHQLRRRRHRPARLRPQRRRARPGQGHRQPDHRGRRRLRRREGFFIDPTVLLGEDPSDAAFTHRVLRPDPVLHVYDDSRPGAYADALRLVDQGRPTR